MLNIINQFLYVKIINKNKINIIYINTSYSFHYSEYKIFSNINKNVYIINKNI